ncbi:MAG: D-alanyl-D-alanine carboxypeptidase/D-alanyl-D-alanine-endopeptidase [Paracoccaceae bacterium]|nr:D-alanyl-D-alanine carboxypeptidase/D-alanyl-D-alanine-endopeptidase [Paracoccaceae bacterium]
MSSGLTRRVVLGGLAASAGSAALAGAPETSLRPLPRVSAPAAPKKLVSQSEYLIQKADLGGDVGYAVADVVTGEVLEARLGTTFLPPASTLKTITAIYALDKLGPSYRFGTEVWATGPVRNGRLDGDLILVGGGDPTLDTDRLADLAVQLRETGLTEVLGDFKIWAGGLPRGDRIDPNQPEHVSYNAAYGGLNLNFNRVHFEWKRAQDDAYDITMHARALRFSPATNIASMSVVDRRTPIFDHWTNGRRDHWSVARRALGKNGARWLPVRYPALYAGDVFRTLARSNGLQLRPAEVLAIPPVGQLLARVESDTLVPVLQGMLKYSTNLTAEVAGLTASATDGSVESLRASARAMASYVSGQGAGRVAFRDHSGLGYDSAITPEDMVAVLRRRHGFAALLKSVNLSMDKARPAPDGVLVRAKTGTLNFVSTLAGFIEVDGGRKLAFAFFSADTARRDAIPAEARENPKGAKSYARRSRQLQKELIRGWARL